VRTPTGWALNDFLLKEPLPAEAVDLPEPDREQVRQMVKLFFSRLKEGKATEIFVSLPNEIGAQYRVGTRSMWQKIFGDGGEPYCILNDLKRVLEFDVQNWPDPDRYLPTAYVSALEVVVIYDVPYVWPEGGIYKEDNLRIEIFLRKKKGGWNYRVLRLYAKGIPGT